MSSPRDYNAFVCLLATLVPIDVRVLRSDRSVGGYLALRVAADQFLHNRKHAFDIEFYRDRQAKGGVATKLMEEPSTDIASAWSVGILTKAIGERFMTHGVLDSRRIHTAIAHDALLRVPHGERIPLEQAALNALSFLRGAIPSRKPEGGGLRQIVDIHSPVRGR